MLEKAKWIGRAVNEIAPQQGNSLENIKER